MKEICSGCFKNLGIESRVKIYSYIANSGQSSVTDITGHVGLTQPTVSYHLNGMLKSGLLSKKQMGKSVIYSVNPTCPHDGMSCIVNAKNQKSKS